MTQPIAVFGMNSTFAARQFLPEIMETARRRGFHVVLIVPRPGSSDPVKVLDLPDIEIRQISMRREIAPAADLWSLVQILWLLLSIRPSVTDMSTPKMALLGGIAAFFARVPHRIYTLRGLRYETARSWKRSLLIACERVACACAHTVLCISGSVKQVAWQDRLAPPEKLTILSERASEGIRIRSESRSAETCGTATLRSRLRIPAGVPVIGFVGRLTRDKGIHELLECLQILRERGRRVCLLLLGNFEAGDRVGSSMEQLIRTGPDIRWPGFVEHPEPYFRIMDLFVFPTYREGLSTVLLEAAAAGLPAVSTRTTGVVDVVVDGITGLLVPPRNASALADAIEKLLDNPQIRSAMGKAAREFVDLHFDNRFYLERFGRMIQAAVDDKAVPDLRLVRSD